MSVVAAYLLLGAIVFAAMSWGIAQITRFLADHPMVRDARDLEDFKVFVRRDMLGALAILPLAIVLIAGSVYMLIEFGFLGFVINLVVLVPSFLLNARLKPLVARARNLECASGELLAEHRRITQIWTDNALPKFEPTVRVSRSGEARLYVVFAIALVAPLAFWADNAYVIAAIVVVGLLIVLGLVVYRRRHQRASQPPNQWFVVTFDDERVTLDARPPGQAPWVGTFRWSEVTRVCFKSEDFTISDGVYVFTTQRPESFVVPMEAKGGEEFWNKVVGLGLFPGEMAIQASTSREGAMLCWPPRSA
jgi:hypothetical protein